MSQSTSALRKSAFFQIQTFEPHLLNHPYLTLRLRLLLHLEPLHFHLHLQVHFHLQLQTLHLRRHLLILLAILQPLLFHQ